MAKKQLKNKLSPGTRQPLGVVFILLSIVVFGFLAYSIYEFLQTHDYAYLIVPAFFAGIYLFFRWFSPPKKKEVKHDV